MELQTQQRQWLSTPRSWASAGHLVVSWSLYAVLAIVALRSPFVAQVPIWIVQAWLLLGNGAVVHECTHRHLFRSAALNRWVGALAGASVLLPFGVYRSYHLAHHRYTVAIEDPEGPPLQFRSRLEYPLLLLGGAAFMIRLASFGLATAGGRPPSWLRTRSQRRNAIVDTLLCLALWVVVIVIGVNDLRALCTVWLVPWLVAMSVLVPLVLVTEHYGAEVGTVEAADNTRTVTSNRLVRWLYWNNNFHTAHHELPTVVHQGLPVLEAMTAAQRDPTWTSSGYLAFHHRTWASLPWLDPSHKARSTTA
jgi:fatty acid desaturase